VIKYGVSDSKLTRTVRDITDDVIDKKLRTSYGITPTHIKRFSRGTENVAWRIESNAGNIIAKLFGGEESTIETVSEEVELYNYINKKGRPFDIRAPRIVYDSNDAPVRSVQNFPLILMKYEIARKLFPSTITHDEVTALSKAIAHMHRILKNKMKDYKKLDYTNWNLDYNKDAYETLINSPNVKEYSVSEVNQYKQVTAKIVSCLEKKKYPDELNESLIHSDIAFEHIRVLQDRSFYFFDWTDRQRGPVARELSVLLFHAYREGDIDFKRLEELRKWILEGYTKVSKLDYTDIGVIVPFMFRRCLDEVKYLSNLAIEIGATVDVSGIRRRYELASRLIQKNK